MASDVPWLEARALVRMPFVERRRRLAAVLEDSDRAVVGRGRKLYLVARGALEALASVSVGRLRGETPREGLWTKP